MLGDGFQYYVRLINRTFGKSRISNKIWSLGPLGIADIFRTIQENFSNVLKQHIFRNIRVLEREHFENVGKGGRWNILMVNTDNLGKREGQHKTKIKLWRVHRGSQILEKVQHVGIPINL